MTHDFKDYRLPHLAVCDSSVLYNITNVKHVCDDLTSIFHKSLSRQLLSATMQLSIFDLMTQLENYFFPNKICKMTTVNRC